MTHSLLSRPNGGHVVYDGKKAVSVDQLMNEAMWTEIGGNVPISRGVRIYYEHVGLLYACTHIRAKSLSKVPWVIQDDSEKTIWEKGQKPPPNLVGLANLPKLLPKTEAALVLGAQSYWHKERNRVRVTGLRWFAPIATEPVWDVEGGLIYFRRHLFKIEVIPPEDMVYLRYEHPLHETMRDRSPGEASMASAGVIYNVDEFVRGFFERGAIKATLLQLEGNPDKDERARLKAWWKRAMSGVANAFGMEVVNGAKITPVVIGEGISELSNTDLTGEKREDLAITLGVPQSMIFSEAANYATATQDEQNFYNSTIVPDCTLIAEQVNEQLLDEMGLHLVFKPETMDIFQQDENDKAQSFATYVNAKIKPSIAAQMLGLVLPEGIEYADLDADQEDAQAAADAQAQAQLAANTAPNGTDPNADPNADPAQTDPAKAADPAFLYEQRQFKNWARNRPNADPSAFHSRLLSAADKAVLLEEMGGGAGQPFFTVKLPEGPITPDVYKALKAMVLQLDPEGDDAEQTIREGIEGRFGRELGNALGAQLTTLLPEGASDDQVRAATGQVAATSGPVREVLRRHLEAASSLGSTVALDTLGRAGMGFDWTLAHAQAARWASQYSFDLVRGINTTTTARLQTAVNDWFQEGTTLPDLVKELEPTFGKRRATLIAQTETTRAAREGGQAGYEQSGVVAETEWVTVNDERVCPVCGPLNGKRAPLRGTYPGGYTQPAHPGCRCFERPVIEEPKKEHNEEPAASRPRQPLGTPVSGALKVPSSGKYAPIYQETLDAIDGVHGDGKLPQIPIVTKTSTDALGNYAFYPRTGEAVRIQIKGPGDHHQLTLAHEIGHFLDYQAISTDPRKPGSEGMGLMDKWRQAVENSAAWQTLQDKKRNPLKYAQTFDLASGRYVFKPDTIFAGYLLDKRELWARSYAQYIATRSGNAAMAKQVAYSRSDPMYAEQQWSEEDFAPIAEAIDELFRSLGWLQ